MTQNIKAELYEALLAVSKDYAKGHKLTLKTIKQVNDTLEKAERLEK
jgi:hypothetical protein